jgi:hypothetical protein
MARHERRKELQEMETYMAFFQNMIDEIEHYPAGNVKLEIVDVEIPGTALNEGERGFFRVRVTNNGSLDLTNVTLRIHGQNGTLVKSIGATSPLVEDFISPVLATVSSGSSEVSPGTTGGFKFEFQAPGEAQGSSTLIKATLENWDASLDHILKDRSNGGPTPRAVFAAEVVGL